MDNKLDIVIFLVVASIGGFMAYKHFWYREPNAIYVGLSPDYKPLAYKEKNVLMGFEVDLMNEVVKRLENNEEKTEKNGEKVGKKLIFKEIDFPALIMSIESKKVDMGVSGISPTTERSRVLDFSNIYFRDKFCFLTKNSKLTNLKSLKNLRVGVQQGSIIQNLATNIWVGKYGFKLILYNLNSQILQTLESGHIDAMLIAYTEGLEIAKQDKKIILNKLNENNESEGYAIAFPKNSKLKEAVNNILSTLEKEGKINELLQKHNMLPFDDDSNHNPKQTE